MMRTLGLAMLLSMTIVAPALAQQPAPLCPCPPPPPPPPVWTGSAGFGLTLNRGNTDTTNVNLSFEAKRDPKTKDVVIFRALYLRGETDGVTSDNRFFMQARYERNLGSRVFAFGQFAYLHDEFKAIDYNVATDGGIGYKLVDRERVKFAVDGGFGAKWEKNPGLDVDTSAIVTAGDSFEFKLSPTAKITQGFKAAWTADDFGDALYTFGAGITASLTAQSELKIALLDTNSTRPPTPDVKKNDVALLVTVVYKF
jgi:putative salt-induced outer membrane protein YdiY